MIIGIDLGGTKIAGGIIKNGKIIRRARVLTEAKKGKAHVLRQIRSVIDTLSEGKPISRVGIGVPGVSSGTTIHSLPNIPVLNGIDLRRALRLRCPVTLNNDATCFAIGEQKFGAGKKSKTLVGITLGTGVGCGIVIDGVPVVGANNRASQASSMIINLQAKSFQYGSHKESWDTLINGKGILERYRRSGGNARQPSDIWNIKTKKARAFQKETARLFAIFLNNVATIIDPDTIIVGGSVVNHTLLKDTKMWLRKFGCDVAIVQTRLGEDATMLGSVAYGF